MERQRQNLFILKRQAWHFNPQETNREALETRTRRIHCLPLNTRNALLQVDLLYNRTCTLGENAAPSGLPRRICALKVRSKL